MNIITMARKAGFEDSYELGYCIERLERFALLVAAVERESCAKVCEELETWSDAEFYGHQFAAAIRARGDHE